METFEEAVLEVAKKFMEKLSHRKWRRLLRKEKRRLERQRIAREQVENAEKEQARIMADPVLRANEDAKRQLQELKEKQEEEKRKQDHYLWLQREAEAQRLFKLKKAEEGRKEQERKMQEQQIKEEWENQEKREKEAKERQEKANKAHEDRLNEELKKSGIIKGDNQEEDWHNPFAPSSAVQDDTQTENYGTEKDLKNCPFFLKTGACRFGERCTRHHVKLNSSQTLLIPGFFMDVRLSEPMLDEHDQDVGLEFDESELYENYRRFYDDVFPEFEKCGRILQFKVCCNHEPHLRGNLYVMYRREDEAVEAYAKFNGRWYAGRQLSVQFCPVMRWRSAICGMFHRNRCPRGKNCNFLHVFRNPGNAFADADRDVYPSSSRHERYDPDSTYHNHAGTPRARDHWHRRDSHKRQHRRRDRGSSSSRSPSPDRRHRRSSDGRRSQKKDRSPHRKRSRSKSPTATRTGSKKRRRLSPSDRKRRNPSHSRSKSPCTSQRNRSRSVRGSSKQKAHSSDSLVAHKNGCRSRPMKGNGSKTNSRVGSSSSSEKESDSSESDEKRGLPGTNEDWEVAKAKGRISATARNASNSDSDRSE